MTEFTAEDLQPIRMSSEDKARLEAAWVAVEMDLRDRTKGSYRNKLVAAKHKAKDNPLILVRLGSLTLDKGPQVVSLVLDFKHNFSGGRPENFWLGIAAHNDTFGRQKFEAIWECSRLPAHMQQAAIDQIPGLVGRYELGVAEAKLRREEAQKARLALEAEEKKLVDKAFAVVAGYLTARGLPLSDPAEAPEPVG